MENCKVCNSKNISRRETLTFFKKEISLFSCNNCYFTFTEKPYWLDLSYSKVINDTDIGLLQRNIFNTEIVIAFLKHFKINLPIIDIAGGYGVLVRLLRDKGIDAYWEDEYCENIFANNFEHIIDRTYGLATGFEFVEHIENPIEELNKIFKTKSENFLFSTLLLPNPIPKANDWWYYGQEHGQHISFYRLETLNFIGNRLKKRVSSNGNNYHFIGNFKINTLRFKLLIKFRKIFMFLSQNETLLKKDYEKLLKKK